ncbi:MAG: hypothetical protein IJB69_00470 [Clostridia bacterium]|nr:hypothetical protein [Clostridia bacterium]
MQYRDTLVRLKGEYVRTEPKASGSKRRIVLPAYILYLRKDGDLGLMVPEA